MAAYLSSVDSLDYEPRNWGEFLMWSSQRDFVIQEISSKAFRSLFVSSALALSGTAIFLGGKYRQNDGLQFHGKLTIGLGVFALLRGAIQHYQSMSKLKIE